MSQTTAIDVPEGITVLEQDVADELQDTTVGVVFETEETTAVQIGESKGNPIYVEGDTFVALSMEGEQTIDEMTAMMQGIETDDEDVVDVDEETGEITMEVDEASVFVSNEEGEVGGGVLQEDGQTLEGVLHLFADENDL